MQGGLAWHQEHIAGLAGGPSCPGSALQPGWLKTGSSWMSRRRSRPRAAATEGGRRDRHQSLQPRQRTRPRSPATGSARRSLHSAHYLHQARPDLVPEGVEGTGFEVPVQGREHVVHRLRSQALPASRTGRCQAVSGALSGPAGGVGTLGRGCGQGGVGMAGRVWAEV